MKTPRRHNRAWLLATAKAVATLLRQQREGTRMRIRAPYRVVETNTDGWQCIIGDLGTGQPRLEIWLDRFPGHTERKLYACFYSWRTNSVLKLSERVAKTLWPTRVISLKDTYDEKFLTLMQPLRRPEFNSPILEKYPDGSTFFGVYDPTRETSGINKHFCNRAVAFFEDVARALPLATAPDASHEVYPQYENRKRVVSHLQRERSRLLGTERKILDEYRCQACGMRFEDVYGRGLGQGYAEAHHVVPLSQLKGRVKTRIEDLRTVCANCHRMLHRMKGQRDDIAKLRGILRKSRTPHPLII